MWLVRDIVLNISVFVLADVSVRSARELFCFVIKINVFRIKVSKKHLIQFLINQKYRVCLYTLANTVLWQRSDVYNKKALPTRDVAADNALVHSFLPNCAQWQGAHSTYRQDFNNAASSISEFAPKYGIQAPRIVAPGDTCSGMPGLTTSQTTYRAAHDTKALEVISDFILADTSVRSPLEMIICIMKIYVYRLKVSQNY